MSSTRRPFSLTSFQPSPSPGRVLLTLAGLGLSAGAFVADWNETHVLNPRWPPHARFHNGQTMSLALILGLWSVYLTWRRLPAALTTDSAAAPTAAAAAVIVAKDNVRNAALVGAVYFVAGLSAIFYPGAKGLDPEFGEGFPQLKLFLAWLAAVGGGWWLETARIDGLAAAVTAGKKAT